MLNSKKTFKPIEISEDDLKLIEFLSLDCTSAEGEWYSDFKIKFDKLGYVIQKGEKLKHSGTALFRAINNPCD